MCSLQHSYVLLSKALQSDSSAHLNIYCFSITYERQCNPVDNVVLDNVVLGFGGMASNFPVLIGDEIAVS